MEVEKKVIISLTAEEEDFLGKLYNAIDVEVCDQYKDCVGCPFFCGTNICVNRKFFSGLKSISDL